MKREIVHYNEQLIWADTSWVGFADPLRDAICRRLSWIPGNRKKISNRSGKRALNADSAEYKFLDIPQRFI